MTASQQVFCTKRSDGWIPAATHTLGAHKVLDMKPTDVVSHEFSRNGSHGWMNLGEPCESLLGTQAKRVMRWRERELAKR